MPKRKASSTITTVRKNLRSATSSTTRENPMKKSRIEKKSLLMFFSHLYFDYIMFLEKESTRTRNFRSNFDQIDSDSDDDTPKLVIDTNKDSNEDASTEKTSKQMALPIERDIETATSETSRKSPTCEETRTETNDNTNSKHVHDDHHTTTSQNSNGENARQEFRFK